MKEISTKTRIDIINDLTEAINHKYGMNICDKLAEELIALLEKEIKKNEIKEYMRTCKSCFLV